MIIFEVYRSRCCHIPFPSLHILSSHEGFLSCYDQFFSAIHRNEASGSVMNQIFFKQSKLQSFCFNKCKGFHTLCFCLVYLQWSLGRRTRITPNAKLQTTTDLLTLVHTINYPVHYVLRISAKHIAKWSYTVRVARNDDIVESEINFQGAGYSN